MVSFIGNSIAVAERLEKNCILFELDRNYDIILTIIK